MNPVAFYQLLSQSCVFELFFFCDQHAHLTKLYIVIVFDIVLQSIGSGQLYTEHCRQTFQPAACTVSLKPSLRRGPAHDWKQCVTGNERRTISVSLCYQLGNIGVNSFFFGPFVSGKPWRCFPDPQPFPFLGLSSDWHLKPSLFDSKGPFLLWGRRRCLCPPEYPCLLSASIGGGLQQTLGSDDPFKNKTNQGS